MSVNLTPITYDGIVSLAEAQAYPPLASVNPSVLATLIADATATIETYCSRKFGPVTGTEKRHGGYRTYRVDNYPIASVSSITVDGVAEDLEDWTINYGSGLIYGTAPRGILNVAITYTGGPTEVPADVKRAALLLIQHLHSLRNVSSGLASETVGPYSKTFAQAIAGADGTGGVGVLPQTVAELLNRYVDHAKLIQ